MVASLQADPDVVVAKTAMFTCSDASQQEIIKDIEEQKLDGIVVASCSPKLHTFTFRDVAKRAGLSPYPVHAGEHPRAVLLDAHRRPRGRHPKAAQLVKAGVGRTRLTVPLEPDRRRDRPQGGRDRRRHRRSEGGARVWPRSGWPCSWWRRRPQLGGWVGGFGDMYPHGKNGRELIARLEEKVREHPGITVFTNAEVVEKSGSFGNYEVSIRVDGGARATPRRSKAPETIKVQAGSLIVATGFEAYQVSGGRVRLRPGGRAHPA